VCIFRLIHIIISYYLAWWSVEGIRSRGVVRRKNKNDFRSRVEPLADLQSVLQRSIRTGSFCVQSRIVLTIKYYNVGIILYTAGRPPLLAHIFRRKPVRGVLNIIIIMYYFQCFYDNILNTARKQSAEDRELRAKHRCPSD